MKIILKNLETTNHFLTVNFCKHPYKIVNKNIYFVFWVFFLCLKTCFLLITKRRVFTLSKNSSRPFPCLQLIWHRVEMTEMTANQSDQN